jgi:hypothetical protein
LLATAFFSVVLRRASAIPARRNQWSGHLRMLNGRAGMAGKEGAKALLPNQDSVNQRLAVGALNF